MKKPSSTLTKLLNLLNDLKFHDGDNLGQELGITRSAVWKQIKKLDDYGIKIDSVKSKGYALLDNLKLMDERAIKPSLNDQDIILEIFETIDSTNDYLKKQSDKTSTRICLAEHQSGGKGRRGRQWHSPFGQNIYLSYAYVFQKDLSQLSGLTLVVSLALIRALSDMNLKDKLLIKWPNDILYQGKKLTGNLIEVFAEANGSCYSIIGIGINCNMLSDDKNITQPWCSLREITGTYIDRNMLAAGIINRLGEYLEKFEQYGLGAFMEEWSMVDMLLNQQVKILSGKEQFQGIAQGINNQGNLLIKLAGGEVKICSSGDTSIIKN
jgi:BirA family biotin operon repressor/biotin-[acetyl-CoA-carboxylase] ligase